MAVAWPYSFEIVFVRNPISGSAAWFFVIILKFIFTPISEIKIHEKKIFEAQYAVSSIPPIVSLLLFQKGSHSNINLFPIY